MNQADYVIDGRFFVDVSTNLLFDKEKANEIRLEPRIMKLLGLLLENRGKVVSRQSIITNVWNDYGGADDGLTQGVSFLRKIFEDQRKQLIMTIPKHGYVLQADVSWKTMPVLHKTPSKRLGSFVAGVGGVVVLIAFYFIFSPGIRNTSPDQIRFGKEQRSGAPTPRIHLPHSQAQTG